MYRVRVQVRVWGAGLRSGSRGRVCVRIRVCTLRPGPEPVPRPVKCFLDPDSTRIRWVSKNKTQTLKKGTGPTGSWTHDHPYLQVQLYLINHIPIVNIMFASRYQDDHTRSIAVIKIRCNNISERVLRERKKNFNFVKLQIP